MEIFRLIRQNFVSIIYLWMNLGLVFDLSTWFHKLNRTRSDTSPVFRVSFSLFSMFSRVSINKKRTKNAYINHLLLCWQTCSSQKTHPNWILVCNKVVWNSFLILFQFFHPPSSSFIYTKFHSKIQSWARLIKHWIDTFSWFLVRVLLCNGIPNIFEEKRD